METLHVLLFKFLLLSIYIKVRTVGVLEVKVIQIYLVANNVLSCVLVTIDGIWIDDWIYWTLTNRSYN
jgi:hypothetical protein